MTRDEVEASLLKALRTVAPEADPGTVDRNADLREELDIDSMDFLNFVTALHRELGIDVPESDYPRLYTLAGALEYLRARRG